jgi:hypothetical protein
MIPEACLISAYSAAIREDKHSLLIIRMLDPSNIL